MKKLSDDRNHSRSYGSTSETASATILSSTNPTSYLWMPSNTSTEKSAWESVADADPPGVTHDDVTSLDEKKLPSQSESAPLISSVYEPHGIDDLKLGITGYQDESVIYKQNQVDTKTNRRTKLFVNVFTCVSIILIVWIFIPWSYLLSTKQTKQVDIVLPSVLDEKVMKVVHQFHYEVDAISHSSNLDSKKLPFSKLDPVIDLGLYNFTRPNGSSPLSSLRDGQYTKNQEMKYKQKNFPTNSWYQNLIMYDNATSNETKPGWEYRVYTIPYIVDVTGPIPGLRIHANQIGASVNIIQLNLIAEYGLTIGTSINPLDNMVADNMTALSSSSTTNSTSDSYNASMPNHDYQYSINQATPLSVTLEWDELFMKSTLSKGMPYATMIYDKFNGMTNINERKSYVPTVAAEIAFAQSPIVDELLPLLCLDLNKENDDKFKIEPLKVQRDIELFFGESDFKWIMFVSEPVYVQCIIIDGLTQIQVLEYVTEPEIDRPLIIRTALSKLCTSGNDPIYCHQERMHPTSWFLGQGNYDQQLRAHAHLFPGPNTTFNYDVVGLRDKNDVLLDEPSTLSILKFDWNVQDTRDYALHPVPLDISLNGNGNMTDKNGTIVIPYGSGTKLVTYALPHHFDMIEEMHPADYNIYCVNTLTGPACLYEGSKWNLKQDLPIIKFTASRPPAPWALAAIGESLHSDLNYTLPAIYEKGIGDTYFSGKMIAKFARILLIADEVTSLCTSTHENAVSPEYVDACNDMVMPSAKSKRDSLERLKRSVEIWINGSAVTPFVYDPAWGGVVSCGCAFREEINTCENKFPDCPGFTDPGLNFGIAFYNDVNFHYGYHIYGAAVVAYLDPEWGRKMWEQVLLLIRSIANPSEDDQYFATFRHKDWYQGHSWASGIAMVFPNGKNQESSSESIHSYEAVALYGQKSAWKDYSIDKMNVAKEIEKVGQIMTASELRSAQFYWHVKTDTKIKIYPAVYTQHAIGILWQTMAQYQTWFGAKPFYASGIQLIPLTPISEFRDSLPWSKGIYYDFATSCDKDKTCESNGWYILQLAMLATVGHPQDALNKTLALDPEIYQSAGGNGHSKTNTIWYLATRRQVDDPLPLTKEEMENEIENSNVTSKPRSKYEVYDCGIPESCSDFVLDTIAGLYTCRQRINWLIQERSNTETQACKEIAVKQHPLQCGRCDPNINPETEIELPRCKACTADECNSHFNRCPMFPRTYVCTKGGSLGGCSETPWDLPSAQCLECCELSKCSRPSPAEKRAKIEKNNCPPCTVEICEGPVNKCPKDAGSQYLCVSGNSKFGCSPLPWEVEEDQCDECCLLSPTCE